MISQEEAKDFIRRYKEVVLDAPSGEVHVCGSKEVCEALMVKESLHSAQTNSSISKRPPRTGHSKPS